MGVTGDWCMYNCRLHFYLNGLSSCHNNIYTCTIMQVVHLPVRNMKYSTQIKSLHWYQLGLGNISIYRQYHNTGVCNNGYHRHFHLSIISLMQYIAEYRNILQCCTIGLSTQSKYVSTTL